MVDLKDVLVSQTEEGRKFEHCVGGKKYVLCLNNIKYDSILQHMILRRRPVFV